MGIYRMVHSSFWTDTKVVEDFTAEDKYFYLYLFTNPKANLCGCFEISIKTAADHMGYSKDTIENCLKRFTEFHKTIQYNKDTKEVLLTNWHKYNWTKSSKYLSPLRKEIDDIKSEDFKNYVGELFNSYLDEALKTDKEKELEQLSKIARINLSDTVSIPYRYRIDTPNIDTPNTNTNANTNTNSFSNSFSNIEIVEENNNLEEIVDYYNTVCTDLPRCTILSSGRVKKLKARLKTFEKESLFTAFDIASKSDFLNGRSTKWKANFDWFIENDSNLTKVIEGNYNNNDTCNSFGNGYTKINNVNQFTNKNAQQLQQCKELYAKYVAEENETKSIWEVNRKGE